MERPRTKRKPLVPAAYRRVVLKVSGESLLGSGGTPVSRESAATLAGEIVSAVAAGAEVGVVIGGGNILRGLSAAAGGADRVTGEFFQSLGEMAESGGGGGGGGGCACACAGCACACACAGGGR